MSSFKRSKTPNSSPKRSITPKWAPKVSITPNWTPGAPKLIVSDGKTMAIFLGFVGLGAIAICSLSIFFLTARRLVFDLAFLFFDMLGPVYSVLFVIANFLPLAAGLAVLGLIITEIIFALLNRRNAAKLEDLETKILGEHFHDRVQRSCGSATNCFFRLGYLLLFANIVLQIAVFAVFVSVYGTVESSIDNPSTGGGIDGIEETISNLQYGIYTECCFNQGFSVQSEIPICDGAPVTSCNIPPEYSQFEEDLCVCYSGTNSSFQQKVATAKANGICDLLSEAQVEIRNDDRIPGTAFPLSSIIALDSVRLVGFPGDPESNPDPNAKEPKGYGCGTGYVKGFQYLTFKLLQQSYYNALLGGLVISILQLVVLCCMGLQFSSSEDDEFYEIYQENFASTPSQTKTEDDDILSRLPTI